MRAGGSKKKGSAFEREVCKKLSLWVSKGQRQDLFWRSAMSGGRATVAKRSGISLAHQAGDITATHPDGHVLTKTFYIECRFYKNIDLGSLLFGQGHTASFWRETVVSALAHRRNPMLIVKQNFIAPLVLVPASREIEKLNCPWSAVAVNDISVAILPFDSMLELPVLSVLRLTWKM